MSDDELLDIVVPQVGEAVSDVTLVTWLKTEGDEVEAGEALFELDTDKAILEVEAFDAGTVHEIRVPNGSTVQPLDVVGVLRKR